MTDPLEKRPEDSLDDLAERIAQAKDKDKANQANEQNNSTNQLSIAWRISIELVSGVAVGGVLGYFMDMWTGLAPAFLMTGLALGAFAGFRNMVRGINATSNEDDKL